MNAVSYGAAAVRALAPTGMLGAGFPEASLLAGMEAGPDFIGCDAGSTDTGPFHLGAGRAYFSRDACKRDLGLMLRAARASHVPLLIGSCGTGGADGQLAWVADIAREIAQQEGLSFKLALVHAEQSKESLKQALAYGRIRPLDPAPPIDERVVDRAAHVVAMMGAEPFQEALRGGADVVLAGRSSDTSIFAAVPRMAGLAPGPVWHAAKILECGAAAVTQRRSSDAMLGLIGKDAFEVEPPNPELACNPQSVASHTLYENGDPFLLVEPGGTLDCSGARYEAVSPRRVRVSGSQFRPASDYTVKLESAELVGYQSLVVAGIRDPLILGQLDDWLAGADTRVRARIREVYRADGDPSRYHLNYRIYGRNAVMGVHETEASSLGHEVGLVIEITAPSQDLATSMVSTASHILLHYPIPEWSGLITVLASPYSPLEIERGPVYRFSMNHVLVVEDPLQPFRIEWQTIGAQEPAGSRA